MTDIRIMLRAAEFELACERCMNNGHITTGRGELDECPRCHGHKKNVATIALLGALVARLSGPNQHSGAEDKT